MEYGIHRSLVPVITLAGINPGCLSVECLRVSNLNLKSDEKVVIVLRITCVPRGPCRNIGIWELRYGQENNMACYWHTTDSKIFPNLGDVMP